MAHRKTRRPTRTMSRLTEIGRNWLKAGVAADHTEFRDTYEKALEAVSTPHPDRARLMEAILARRITPIATLPTVSMISLVRTFECECG